MLLKMLHIIYDNCLMTNDLGRLRGLKWLGFCPRTNEGCVCVKENVCLCVKNNVCVWRVCVCERESMEEVYPMTYCAILPPLLLLYVTTVLTDVCSSSQ